MFDLFGKHCCPAILKTCQLLSDDEEEMFWANYKKY